MKKLCYILTLLLLITVSCKDKTQKSSSLTPRQTKSIAIDRFEQVIFETPVATLQQKLTEVQATYNSELMDIYPDDPEYMALMTGFVQDPTILEIYKAVKQRYADLSWLSDQLTPALKKSAKLLPNTHYDRCFTMVAGTFDYNSRIMLSEHDILICIDQYVLPQMERYGYFGCPRYIANISDSAYLAPDCMAAIARQHIAIPAGRDMQLIDYMIAEGKALYFLDKVMPKVDSRYKIRHTEAQWEWTVQNEKNVWGYLLQNHLLYVSDMNRIHSFIEDAPKTNAFGNQSAPRTTDYIGWQIVEAYAKKSGASMEELFAETNSQKILNTANYRP